MIPKGIMPRLPTQWLKTRNFRGHRANQACYKSGIIFPRIPDVRKGYNQRNPFKNQGDNSTRKNTCRVSSALAVRLFDKDDMLVDNEFTQGTVVSKNVEVPIW